MKKTVFGCLGAAAIAFALQFTQADVEAALFSACTPCDEVACFPCDESASCDPCDPICGSKAGKWFLNGYMEAGFFANAWGSKSTYGGGGSYFFPGRGADMTSGNTDLLMNTRLTGAQINQVYVSAGKKVDGRRGLDIGGTVDFTWGSDAYVVQARGMEFDGPGIGRWGTGDYNTAFAQAYAEVAYGRWNVLVGKFYAPFGSSGYKSTDNFFYSWASTALIAPHVAGGAYAIYKASDKLSLIGGWAMPDELGESSHNNAAIGGVIWNPTNKLDLRYTFAIGTNSYQGNAFGESTDLFVNTFTSTSQLTRRLKYAFEWTLLNVNNGAGKSAAYGLNNEIIFQATDKFALGTRFGMLNFNPAYAGLYEGFGIAGDTDWYTVAIGANWTPNKWLIVKPEVRYDWMDPDASKPFHGDLSKHTQFTGGMSAIVKF